MKIINTINAPSAIGPYSQAVINDDLLYTSGQIAINPKTKLIETNDIVSQTHQVFKNLEAILKEANSSFEQVIKTTVFIKDMNEFNLLNQVYGEYFKNHKPARSTVEVARLPRDVKVEIELIAKIK